MSENNFRTNCILARRRHDAILAAGRNPTLTDVQRELLALDGKRFTENDVAGFLLGEPLDAGRRGLTGKSLQADAATRRAAEASRLAEDSDDPALHENAKQAHHDAATYHAACVAYHHQQREYHHGRSNPAEPETTGQKADDKPGESTTPWDWLGGLPDSTASAAEAARLVQPPLCCARALPSLLGSATVPDVILYMPSGTHRITPSQGGKPVTVVVLINELSADRMEQQRQALAAGGGKPFFSVQHNTQIAAFWPSRFFWDTRPDPTGAVVSGVWASGEWSQAGKDAVEGKNFRSFSPTFFVDKISVDAEDPAQVQCNPDAPLNIGALENDPAFGGAMSPLWPDQPRA